MIRLTGGLQSRHSHCHASLQAQARQERELLELGLLSGQAQSSAGIDEAAAGKLVVRLPEGTMPGYP